MALLTRSPVSAEIEDAIRDLLKKGTGIHRTLKLVKKRLELKTLGAGTVQRIRASLDTAEKAS